MAMSLKIKTLKRLSFNSVICILQALFTRDDDTSDEEEDEAEAPDMIAADELQGGGVSEIPGSKQRWLINQVLFFELWLQTAKCNTSWLNS